jgi:hypothetical protein
MVARMNQRDAHVVLIMLATAIGMHHHDTGAIAAAVAHAFTAADSDPLVPRGSQARLALLRAG